jgi:hypothetical protein
MRRKCSGHNLGVSGRCAAASGGSIGQRRAQGARVKVWIGGWPGPARTTPWALITCCASSRGVGRVRAPSTPARWSRGWGAGVLLSPPTCTACKASRRCRNAGRPAALRRRDALRAGTEDPTHRGEHEASMLGSWAVACLCAAVLWLVLCQAKALTAVILAVPWRLAGVRDTWVMFCSRLARRRLS